MTSIPTADELFQAHTAADLDTPRKVRATSVIDGLTSGVHVDSSCQRHITQGEVFRLAESCADKQVPELIWGHHGVVPIEEVAVNARRGPGYELAQHLFEQHGADLMADAQGQRAGAAS